MSTSWSCSLATLLGILSFAAFFYLIDYAARLLRPISILTHVGSDGLAVIESVYPDPSLGPDSPERRKRSTLVPRRAVIRHQGTSAIVLAVNLARLMAEAEQSGGIIEFVPEVGDFVAVDEPLFNLYGGARFNPRGHAAGAGRVRVGTNDRPGSDFRVSYRRRHCAEGRCRRPLTIRPRACSRSTSSTACFEWSASAICAPTKSWTGPDNCA